MTLEQLHSICGDHIFGPQVKNAILRAQDNVMQLDIASLFCFSKWGKMCVIESNVLFVFFFCFEDLHGLGESLLGKSEIETSYPRPTERCHGRLHLGRRHRSRQ